MEPNINENREFGSTVSTGSLGSTARQAKDKAKSVISDLSESASTSMEDFQQIAREYTEAGEDFVRKHPFSTVLGAAAVGVVLGLILRGRD